MKYLKITFGLALVAGLMVVTTSSALAQPRWVHCVKGKGWMSGCLAGDGEWETKATSETSEETMSTPVPFELEDKKAGTAITCTGTGTGTFSAGGGGSVTTIKAGACKIVSGKAGSCEEPVTARAVNLGWSTELEEKSGEVRNQVQSLISGKKPGYVIECFVAGILKITDECTGNISASVRANRTAGTIEASFEKVSESELGNCSVGGEKQGRVSGGVDIKLRIAVSAVWILAPFFGT